MNHPELIAQIRFQLSTLRDRNEHHAFEHLCRKLARVRICSNILPATGPVAAGGDQGRDFETFRTYLQTEIPRTSTFVGAGTASETIAFACTTQLYSSGLAAKISEDIAKIMESGTSVDSIYFFCTEAIPAAKQHEVRDKARDEHSVELWIIDREALAEQLADPETFSIASEYLHISADLYPTPSPTESDQWYRDMKEEWSNPERTPATYADFSNLKLAIREASHNDQLFPDLPFWVSRLREMTTEHHPLKLKLRAIYEVAVGLLLAHRDMNSETENLAHYFESVVTLPDGDVPTDLLLDAAVLLTFSTVAVEVHQVGLSREQVAGWHKVLLAKTARVLNHTSSVTLRCELLQAQAQLYMVESIALGELPGDKAFGAWLKLADAAESAPLFPLERFANFVTKSLPYLAKHPSYRTLAQKVDMLLGKRVGSRAAAEKCRERAMAFFEIGDVLAAIAELHDAKVKWYSSETIVPSLLTFLNISGFYQQLGLNYAAKQYALAAASLAFWSDIPEAKKITSSAVAQVALIDYILGNWTSVIPTAELAARLQAEYVGDFSVDPGGRIKEGLLASGFVLAALDYVGVRLPKGENFQFPILEQLGLAEYQEQALPAFTGNGFTGLREMAAENLYGFPLGDLFESVETVWVALGIRWHATWTNDYDTTVTAEGLLSSLQILLADLAVHDLHTLPTQVSMVIRRGSVSSPEFSYGDRQISDSWIITIPATTVDDNLPYNIDDEQVVTLCFEMVRRISVLPGEQLMAIMEECFRQGVSSKLFVAKPFAELYREVHTREEFDAFPRIPNHLVESPLVFPQQHPQMAAFTGLSPLYSQSVAQHLIRNRYKHVQEEIPVTLARLTADSTFRKTLSALRENGWKDWHVLQAIANTFYNFHIQDWIKVGLSPSEIAKRVDILRQDQAELTRLEVSRPVPLEMFTEERLVTILSISMGATMKGLGLAFYDDRIELDAIASFMDERFNFWNDDVEHVDPFSPPPPGIILPLSED